VNTPVTPKVDLAIDKSDSQDPVAPGAQLTYTLRVTNNGPSNASGVVVRDHLPSQATYVTASPGAVVAGREVTFNVGALAAGASATFTITVSVNPTFVGTLNNSSEVTGNEAEINLNNNFDEEPTLVKVDPASIDGFVYNDKNNNGAREAGEKPLAGVVITLSGKDFAGATVSRTTITNAGGYYSFVDLMPGTYQVVQPNQPVKYRDGFDTLGNTFNGAGQLQLPNGRLAIDQNANDDRDADAFGNIVLKSGFAAKDYNFGELAVTSSKRDLMRPFAWR
jgi:uncharacterized repeat protein (TIGR01451 family)